MRFAFRRLYNWLIRPHTPRKIAVFNGVPVRAVRLFDQSDVFPGYEEPLIEGIRTHVNEGDSVVVVGGGRGVSSVVAAVRAGRSGQVVTFEGSADLVERLRETTRLNGVDDRVSVRHAVVGSAVRLAGEPDGASAVAPAQLPSSTVLVLDCEGAEIEILEDYEGSPRLVIVETHGFLDAPESAVQNQLAERGYEVVHRGVEDRDKGVVVLTAVNRSESPVDE